MHKNQNWNSLSRELVNGRNINGTLTEYNVHEFNIMTGPSVGTFDLPTLYGYKYDNINRLKKADAAVGDFIQPDGLALESRMIGDVTLMYDRIGNIKSLHRTLRNDYDTVGAPYTKLQHFNYLYSNGENRLNTAQGLSGTTTRAYTYDANGNLLTDDSKDLLVKEYGRASYAFELEVDHATVSYLYSSDDQRIYKRHTEGDETTENYYLVNAMGQTVAIYQKNDSLSSWEYYASGAEREARLLPTTNQTPGSNSSINTGFSSPEETHFGSQMVTFFLYDHLGNTRVTYTPRTISMDSLSMNNLNYIADYFPYGKVVREYVGTDKERYLTTQHERDEETGLDNRGARWYCSDVARFLSLDPHATTYPSLSAYSYVAGNPLVFVDSDGRDIEPSEDFRSSSYYSTFLDLLYHNKTFRDEIVGSYATNPDYHYQLDLNASLENQTKIPPGSDAITFTESKGYMSGDTPILTQMFSEQYYTVESSYFRTEIGRAHLLIHEAIHSLAGLLLDRSPDGHDHDHRVWEKYVGTMEKALNEYSEHAGFNLSKTQIREMSLWGTEGSDIFGNHIKNLSEKSGKSYQEEYDNYSERVNALMWDYGE